jgi:hypothetical protein
MTSRILRAILIGPAVVPAGALIFAIASGFRLRESVAVAAIYGAFSYGGSLILGVPAHLALERSELTSLWHYLIAGAILGTVVPVVVATVLEQIALLNPAALLVFGLSGAMVAAVFWAFACWPARSVDSHTD